MKTISVVKTITRTFYIFCVVRLDCSIDIELVNAFSNSKLIFLLNVCLGNPIPSEVKLRKNIIISGFFDNASSISLTLILRS